MRAITGLSVAAFLMVSGTRGAPVSNTFERTAVISGQTVTFYDPQPFVTVTNDQGYPETYRISTYTVFTGILPVPTYTVQVKRKNDPAPAEETAPVNDLPEPLNYIPTTYSVTVTARTVTDETDGTVMTLPERVAKVVEGPASRIGATGLVAVAPAAASPATTTPPSLAARGDGLGVGLAGIALGDPSGEWCSLVEGFVPFVGEAGCSASAVITVTDLIPHSTVVGEWTESGTAYTLVWDTSIPPAKAARSLPPSPVFVRATETPMTSGTNISQDSTPVPGSTSTFHTVPTANSSATRKGPKFPGKAVVTVTNVVTILATDPHASAYGETTSPDQGATPTAFTSLSGHTYATLVNSVNPGQTVTLDVGSSETDHSSTSTSVQLPTTSSEGTDSSVQTSLTIIATTTAVSSSTGDIWSQSGIPPPQTADLSGSSSLINFNGGHRIVHTTIAMGLIAAAAAVFL